MPAYRVHSELSYRTRQNALPTLPKTPVKVLDRPHVRGFDINVNEVELVILIANLVLLVLVLFWLALVVIGCFVRYIRWFLHGAASQRTKRSVVKTDMLQMMYGATRIGPLAEQQLPHAPVEITENTRGEKESMLTVDYDEGDIDLEIGRRNSVVHREDCEGQCGKITRRRSAE